MPAHARGRVGVGGGVGVGVGGGGGGGGGGAGLDLARLERLVVLKDFAREDESLLRHRSEVELCLQLLLHCDDGVRALDRDVVLGLVHCLDVNLCGEGGAPSSNSHYVFPPLLPPPNPSLRALC